jgi:energy-coupling factor transporter ATP-binding protein EcfA2
MYRLIYSRKLIEWDIEQRNKLLEAKKTKTNKDVETIISNKINTQHEKNKEQDPRYYFTIKPLQQYLESVDLSNSSVQVEYTVSEYGRFKNKTIQGIPYSYTNMFHQVRNLSTAEYVYDIDIKNCHATLLLNICNELNITCPELGDFCNNRNDYITDIVKETNISKQDIKSFLNKILYKWVDNDITESFRNQFGILPPKWLTKLKQEISHNTISIINNPKYDKIKEWKLNILSHQKKTYNKEGKILSIIIQDLERQILTYLYEIIINDGIIVSTLIHDGMHINKFTNQNVFITPSILESKLNTWITQVNNYYKFSYPLELINKPMDIDNSYLETTSDFSVYYHHKKKFEKTFFKIKSPLMYRYNTTYKITLSAKYNGIAPTKLPNNEDTRATISEFYSYDRFVKHDELIKAEQDHQYKDFIKKWLEDPYKRQYDTLIFYPYSDRISGLSNNIYNTFDGFEIIKYIDPIQNKSMTDEQPDIKQLQDKFANKCNILLNHIRKLGKDNNGFNFLCNWIAHILQYPEIKTGCCIVLKGKQGKGKNTLYNILKAIIGEKYCVETANIEHIYGKFAGCRADKLLVLLDEVEFRNTKDELGKIKTSITTDNFILEKKGIDGITYRSYENYIFASNNDLCIPIEESNRRFFVIDVNDIDYGDNDEIKTYFNNIYKIIGDNTHKPDYATLIAFYNYMILMQNVNEYDFRKAIIIFSKDALNITIRNPVDTFLEQLLYKEAEKDFEEIKYTKETGYGIRKKKINDIDILQCIYKQTYLYKRYNEFYKTISNKECNIHNNMFSRELTKDRQYISDAKIDGFNIIIINVDEWKEAYDFRITTENDF